MKDSRNNNDDDLLTGAFNVMFNHINKKMQNSLPVKVTKVSSDRKFVNVQPQILVVDSEGGTIIRGEIKGIPVVTSGGGNFLISFNISIGDLGWIESSDRDISLFKQSYDQSKPNTKRMHNFSDARFIPDIMTNFTIDDEDSDCMTIQNRDNTVKISLSNERIKIKSPKAILETTGNIDISCGGNMTAEVTGNTILNSNGDVEVATTNFKVAASGGADINGFTIGANGAAESPISITAPSAVIDSKELAGHDHDKGTYKDAESRPLLSGNSGANN